MLARKWRRRRKVGGIKLINIMKHSMDTPQKIKNRTTTWSSSATSEYLPSENEIPVLK